jgi:hypothetical protein
MDLSADGAMALRGRDRLRLATTSDEQRAPHDPSPTPQRVDRSDGVTEFRFVLGNQFVS